MASHGLCLTTHPQWGVSVLSLPMLLVRGVHHFSVTVSFRPLSLLVLPAMCRSPAGVTKQQ